MKEKVIKYKYLQIICELCEKKKHGDKKYMNMYVELITRCLENPISDDQISEKHHILCVCLKGPNDKENYVRLTTYDHIKAHILLKYIYQTEKIIKLFLSSHDR